jgi:hypothetical protein
MTEDRPAHRLKRLCREFNVKIVPNTGGRSARQTCAGKTLEWLITVRGYAHARLVVMSIVETKPNKLMLVAPVLLAISDVLKLHPDWFGDKWLGALDAISLAELHELARQSREVVQPRQAIAMMLIERMRPLFVIAKEEVRS